MRKEDRLAAIVEKLREDGFIKNNELSKLFGTSEMTIWRDIDELEKAGVLKRVFGGAVDIKASSYTESHVNERVFENTSAKEKIARYAVSMVKTNDRVFIDSGSTGYIIAKYLAKENKRLFCSTNTINTAAELCNNPAIKTVMIGGELKGNSMCSIGPVAESQLKNYKFSYSFVACNAIDDNGRVMVLDISERSIKHSIIDVSEKCYLICDSSKISCTSMIEFATVDEFTGIIVDSGISERQKHLLESKGATIIVA